MAIWCAYAEIRDSKGPWRTLCLLWPPGLLQLQQIPLHWRARVYPSACAGQVWHFGVVLAHIRSPCHADQCYSYSKCRHILGCRGGRSCLGASVFISDENADCDLLPSVRSHTRLLGQIHRVDLPCGHEQVLYGRHHLQHPHRRLASRTTSSICTSLTNYQFTEDMAVRNVFPWRIVRGPVLKWASYVH